MPALIHFAESPRSELRKVLNFDEYEPWASSGGGGGGDDDDDDDDIDVKGGGGSTAATLIEVAWLDIIAVTRISLGTFLREYPKE